MPETSSSDLTGTVVAAILFLVGGGGVLGWAKYLLERRRQPADLQLIGAQVEVQQATAEKTRAEGQRAVTDGLLLAAQGLTRDVERLRQERDGLRERLEKAEALIGQLKEQQRMRHDLANRAYIAEMKLAFLKAGYTLESLPEIKPLYDLDEEK